MKIKRQSVSYERICYWIGAIALLFIIAGVALAECIPVCVSCLAIAGILVHIENKIEIECGFREA